MVNKNRLDLTTSTTSTSSTTFWYATKFLAGVRELVNSNTMAIPSVYSKISLVVNITSLLAKKLYP